MAVVDYEEVSIDASIAALAEPTKTEVAKLFARLRACEAKVGRGDAFDGLRALFVRLEAAEVGVVGRLGGTDVMVDVLTRLQRAEAALRERDVFGKQGDAAPPPAPPILEPNGPSTVAPPPAAKPVPATKPPAPVPAPVAKAPPPVAKAPPPVAKAAAKPAPVVLKETQAVAPPVPAPVVLKETQAVVEPPPVPAKAVATYPLAQLKTGAAFPEGIDVAHREKHLSEDDFNAVFGMGPSDFAKLPKWKQDGKKKAAGLF